VLFNTFLQVKIEKVYFWMDNGPVHFRTYEFQYFLWNLSTPPPQQQQSSPPFTCEWNYFVEGHGKSICDAHFSKVSLALSLWSKQQDHVIDGTHIAMKAISDMFSCWKSQAEQSNERKKRINKHNASFYDLHLFELIIPQIPTTQNVLRFENMKVYFHFQVQNRKLFTSLLTGHSL